MRFCARCGAEYHDDDNTLCPHCDAEGRAGAAPHVFELRMWYQKNLAKGRRFDADEPDNPMPEFLRR